MNYIDEKTFSVNGQEITAYKVNHDSNGNPRWVVHFLDLLTDAEKEEACSEANKCAAFMPSTQVMFRDALNKARKAGGMKYRAKWFGGGIVFQSYNIQEEVANVFAA